MTITNTPIEVDERIDNVSFGLNDKKSADELISIISDMKSKYLKLKWTDVKVGLERKSKEEIDIVFYGCRLEEQSETQARINTISMKQKFMEEQEMKEYLRLKRKFENKSNSDLSSDT